MKTTTTLVLLIYAAVCATAFTATAATFTENFDSPALNTNLFVIFSTNQFPSPITGTNGFSFEVSGGRGWMGKEAGVGNGLVCLKSQCALIGNFTVTVECGRTGLAPSSAFGLGVGPLFARYGADIYFLSSDVINANIFFREPPGFGSRYVPTTTSTASFRIIRTGNTLSFQYNTGSGFVTLHSATDSSLARPVALVAFLMNQHGDAASYNGWLDNLNVTADQFLYPPWPGSDSLICPAVEICWPTHLDRWYQVQWCSVLDTNAWLDFGLPILGNGATNCVFDSTRSQDRRFYRVMEAP